MTNTLHSPAYFYLRSIKTEPIRDIPFWKKKSISIRLLIVTNCSIWICVVFFFIIGFFFSRTEKKITIDSDFTVGTEYPEISLG